MSKRAHGMLSIRSRITGTRDLNWVGQQREGRRRQRLKKKGKTRRRLIFQTRMERNLKGRERPPVMRRRLEEGGEERPKGKRPRYSGDLHSNIPYLSPGFSGSARGSIHNMEQRALLLLRNLADATKHSSLAYHHSRIIMPCFENDPPNVRT